MSNSNESFKRLDETCIQIDGQNYYRFCSQPVTIEHDSQMMRVGTACVLPVGHEGKTHVDYYGVWKVDEEAFDFNEVAYLPLTEVYGDFPKVDLPPTRNIFENSADAALIREADEQKDKSSDPRIDFTDIKVEDFFNRLDKFLYERDKRKKTEQYDNWLKTWREASSKPSFVVDADIKPIDYCSGKPTIYTVDEKRSPWWKRIFRR